MDAQIEVISGGHSWRISLGADRTTVGKAADKFGVGGDQSNRRSRLAN